MKQFLILLTLIMGFTFAAQTAQASIPAFSGISISAAQTMGEPNAKEGQKTIAPKKSIFTKVGQWVKKTMEGDNTAGIISYLGPIGWLIALLAFKPLSDNSAFHLRNTLGIYITMIVFAILLIIPILGWIAYAVMGILSLISWIIGLISAISGTEKGALLFGNLYQKWFAGIK
jgi:uncharacterized membrane protein